MRLMELVLSQPQKELLKRIKMKDLSCNTNSRQEMTEQLVNNILNKKRAKEEWQRMSHEEKHLLLRICFSATPLALTEGELRIFLRKDERSKFQSVVTSLMENSWLFQDRSQFFHVPEELQKWSLQFFREEMEENTIFLLREKGTNYTIVDDLFQMMDSFEETSLPLTKSKTLYKTHLNKLLSQLSLKEEIPKEQWRFGYGRHFDFYPDYFSLLYDFCYEQGWLMEGEVLVVTQKWEVDQGMSLNELLEKIERTYVKLYRRPIPQLPFVINAVKHCLRDGVGIEREALMKIFKNFVDPYYYDDVENIMEKRILNMLVSLHILESRELDGCEYVVLHPRYLEKEGL